MYQVRRQVADTYIQAHLQLAKRYGFKDSLGERKRRFKRGKEEKTLYCKNRPYTLETNSGGFPKTALLSDFRLALGDWHTGFVTEAAEAPTPDTMKGAELV